MLFILQTNYYICRKYLFKYWKFNWSDFEFLQRKKIKRIHQFDIIVAGDYTIVNPCKWQISFNDVRGIFFEKTEKKTLAVLLFLMANMTLVHHTYNENIYNIYLDKIFTNASYRDDWNKFLEDIENS